MKEAELRRGARQIMEAFGSSDLWDIVAVRKSFQLVSNSRTAAPAKAKDLDEWAGVWVSESGHRSNHGMTVENEEGDEGGDEALARAADKDRLRIKRSFELLLVSGQVFRFEVCIQPSFVQPTIW